MIKSYLQAFFIGLPTLCHRPPLLRFCCCTLSEPLAPAWNLTTPYVAAQLGSGGGTVTNQVIIKRQACGRKKAHSSKEWMGRMWAN